VRCETEGRRIPNPVEGEEAEIAAKKVGGGVPSAGLFAEKPVQ
jgi:hypothetical protein